MLSYFNNDHDETLRIINDIQFTHREIDILACIISGRGAKTISSLLKITPKTVEAHTRNIMQKLGCNSRESIITFIEKSDKFSIIKKHYLFLLTQVEFEEKLKEISLLIKNNALLCNLVYEETESSFVDQLKRDLNQAGIKVFPKIRTSSESMAKFILDTPLDATHSFLYYKPKVGSIFQKEDNENTLEFSALIKRNSQYPQTIFFLLSDEKTVMEVSKIIPDGIFINFEKEKNYYSLFFNILKKLLPNISLEQESAEFIKKCTSDEMLSEAPPALSCSKKDKKLAKTALNKESPLFLHGRSIKYISIILFSICIIFLLIFFEGFKYKKNQDSLIVSTNLSIPNDLNFLDRPALFSQIDQKLKSSQRTQVVALVGAAGSGKTTLARHYVRSQDAPVRWEINAETNEALLHSFETLAYALSENDAERRALSFLQEINNSTKRADALMALLRTRLQRTTSWILIYDHVNNFAEIEKYFPFDSNNWGKGKVIITSRDSNITNNDFLKHSIDVVELSNKEKLELFLKILNEKRYSLSSAQREQIEKFLANIPPYPLDVSIAGKYIKMTNSSYDEYLENLQGNLENFSNTVNNILKDSGLYNKTRYAIITLSLRKIMDTQPDFADLLLFISLLDSQRIPKDLLSKYKSNLVINEFIHNLKKYSLVLNVSPSPLSPISSISIHQSTQEIVLSYLIKVLKLTPNNKMLKSISASLERYMEEITTHEDLSRMKVIFSHIKTFLSHVSLLDNDVRGLLESELGYIYFYLGDYSKSQKNLERSLVLLNENTTSNAHRIAKTSTYLGRLHNEFDNHDEAKKFFEKSLAIYRVNPSKNQFEIAQVLAHLGNTYRVRGDYRNAIHFLSESLTIYKNNPSFSPVGLAQTLFNLGRVYRALGSYEKAQSLLEQGLVIYKTRFPENYVAITTVSTHLGKVYYNLGNYSKAKEIYEENLETHKKLFGDNNIRTAYALALLGNVYNELGDFQKAKEILEKSLTLHKTHLQNNDIRFSLVSASLGTTYMHMKEYKKAKQIFETVLANFKTNFGENHIQTARILRSLGQINLLEDNLEEAEPLLLAALNTFQENKHPDCYMFLESLADLNLKKSQKRKREGKGDQEVECKNKANAYLHQALKILHVHFPKETPHIKRIQKKLNS